MEKVVVNPVILEALGKSASVVTDVNERYKYVNGQRTTESNGYRVSVVCIEGPCIGETFAINVTGPIELKPQTKVTCVVDKATPYVRTSNRGYSTVQISLSGKVKEVAR